MNFIQKLKVVILIKKCWRDPVLSKVFATAITALAISSWPSIQSIFKKISLRDSYRESLSFFSSATPINNFVILLAVFFLLWYIFFLTRKIILKSTSNKKTSALPVKPQENVAGQLLQKEAPIPAPMSASVPVPEGKPVLLRFSSQPGDENLFVNFKSTARGPKVTVAFDGHYGQILQFNVNSQHEQINCLQLKPAGRQGTYVSFVYRKGTGITFYLLLLMQAGKNEQTTHKSLALRSDITEVSQGANSDEKEYPATWNPDIGDWVISTYHIPSLVNDTFGPEGWRYHSLAGFRIRGAGALASVTIF